MINSNNLKKKKKGKEELTPEQKAELLITFVKEYKRVPKQKQEYKDFKIGVFWTSIKCTGRHKELYDTKLKNNSILKEDYDKTQQFKEKKGEEELTPEQKADLLIEFVEKYKRVPKKTKEYKDFKIGSFWGTVKQGHNKELYDTKLKNNSILKDAYDKLQQLKEEKKR